MKKYAQENIRLLKGFYAAASGGNFGPVRDALDPNVEWIEPNVPGLWFSGTHRGADAVWQEVIAPTVEKIDSFRVNMRKFYGVGDHIIAIGYFRGRDKATGKELDAATAHICTLRNGRIVRFETFHDTASWLETLGLTQAEPQRMAA
jgi:ketosteroid isomerase-like protein